MNSIAPSYPLTNSETETIIFDDQRVYLRNLSWEQFEQFLDMRGDEPGVRIAYVNGDLELMSPSMDHESIKKTIARLIEIYAIEKNIELKGCGSWTLKDKARKLGIEPDECYIVGTNPKEAPDLAIEVVWTSGGIDKLEIYREFGVAEVWMWQKKQLFIFGLIDGDYRELKSSQLFPDLNLALLVQHIDPDHQTASARAYWNALRT